MLLSKRRKTIDYIKDNVFDSIDIERALKENKQIPKIDLKSFIYIAQIPNRTQSQKAIKSFSSLIPVAVNKANKDNQFSIKINELFIENKNGYKEPFDLKYQVIEVIGEGAFGLVLSIIDRQTNFKMAVKIIQKQKTFHLDQNLKNEAHILNRLNHKRIVKIHEVIETNDYLFIFMDLIEGWSLKEMIIYRYLSKREFLFTDFECSLIIKGILEGIEYIHSKNIVHRDIKPENIMFKDSNDLDSLIICDFGVSEDITHMTPEQCGTTLYMTPEMLLERRCDQLIDVWATGIILYVISSGGKHPIYKYPMSSNNYVDSLLLKNDWTFPEQFPILARNLFLKLCKYEPIYRYNSDKAIKHPWITRSSQSAIPLTIADTYEQKCKIEIFKTMLTAIVLLKNFKASHQETNLLQCKVQRKEHLNLITTLKTTKNSPSSPFAKKRITQLKLRSLIMSPSFRNSKINKTNAKPNITSKEDKANNKLNSDKKQSKLLLSNISKYPKKKEKVCLFPPLLKHNKSLKPLKLTIRKTASCGFMLENNGFQQKHNSKTQRSSLFKHCFN